MDKKFNIKSILISKITKFTTVDLNNFVHSDEFLDNIANCIKQGSNLIILLTSNVSSNRLISAGTKLRQLCSMFDSQLYVSDRADIAKIIDADGLILSDTSYSIQNAKKILDKEKLYGFLTDNNHVKVDDDFDFLISFKTHSITKNKE